MERPRIVVIEQRHYPHRDVYEEEIESYRGAGYRVAFRVGSTNPEKGYVVMEEVE